MNEYTLINYDVSTDNKLLKDVIFNLFNKYLLDNKVSNPNAFNHLMNDITYYKTKIYIAYDGGYPFGIIVCSTKTFFFHQIINFISLEDKYQTNEVYNILFDLIITTSQYKGLAIISQNTISNEYLNSGFFQVDFKNSHKSLIYLRTLNPKDKLNPNDYLKKHVKYQKKYISIYSSFYYILSVFVISILSFLIATESSDTLFINYILPIISIGLFTGLVISKYLLKSYNTQGLINFGFEYDMVYIKKFQYKFRNKSQETFLAFVNAYIDSGI